MPFTPIHLGPGAAFKAVLGRHFSFLVFGGAQVLMDLQPLAAMLGADVALHGRSHTWVGALLIGVVAFATGKPVSDFVLRRSGVAHRPLTWAATAAGAWIGTFSHVALDSIMHADVVPGWPWFAGSPLLYSLSFGELHAACVVLGVVGAGVVGWRLRGKGAGKGASPH